MKKVLIIYTGGTIGMMPSKRGLLPRRGYFTHELMRIPELSSPSMPLWDIIEMDSILDSSNISLEEWNAVGQLISDNYERYCGFVVVHGTDTMAYTASALSFMLTGLNKPVVFTGAQIPLCMLRSDGRSNLITSLIIAAEGIVKEVCLYFGSKLLRGNRTVKVSADRLDAYRSYSYPCLANAEITIKYNFSALLRSSGNKLCFQKLKYIPICVLKIFPGIHLDIFEDMITEKIKGLVIETFGSGNIPGSGDKLMHIIEKAFANNTIVVVCSQCLQGTVSLGRYETSSLLKKAGAVSGHDMTTEAAVAKLYYLFSRGLDAPEIKRLMELPLVGELTD